MTNYTPTSRFRVDQRQKGERPEWRTKDRKPESRIDEVFRRYRYRSGMSQFDLAMKLRIQPSYIAKIERGDVKSPTLHLFFPLLAELGIPFAEGYKAATGQDMPADPGAPDNWPDDVRTFAAELSSLEPGLREQVYTTVRALLHAA